MARRPMRKPPKQGAHLAALRKAVGLTQAELGEAVGVPQANIAFWEFADKPPRGDVLLALAKVLGVTVEEILAPGTEVSGVKRRGPKGRLLKVFEAASALPKEKQKLLEAFVSTLLAQKKEG